MKPQEIYIKFNGKLIGNRRMRKFVCETLSRMPDEVIEAITSTCWFFASMDDAWAFTFTGNDLANQHLIFLGDDLLSQSPTQIHYTIAHEVGHVMLKHRNSTLIKQTKEEISKQEKEAHAFATDYFPAP